jgi:hypothetical protein
VLTFPLKWFDHTERIQPTSLLGENLSDTHVFLLMGRVGALLANVGRIPIRAFQRHGGGGATATLLEHIAESGVMCLCIADSDKASPAGTLGSTARALQKYKDAARFPLIEVAETAGRDLENGLPDSFYAARYGGHLTYSRVSRLLGDLTTLGESDIRSHLDIEKGLTLFDVWNYAQNSDEGSFWIGKLAALMGVLGHSAGDFRCLTTSVCLHTRRCDCECVIVSGNGANILDDFVDWYEHMDPHALKQALDDSVRDEWERLGWMVASWCCADERVRL